jgi:hypothetical protein
MTAIKAIFYLLKGSSMAASALLIFLAGIIIAMAAQQDRRGLPAETIILLVLLDRLQTGPEDADPPDSRSA